MTAGSVAVIEALPWIDRTPALYCVIDNAVVGITVNGVTIGCCRPLTARRLRRDPELLTLKIGPYESQTRRSIYSGALLRQKKKVPSLKVVMNVIVLLCSSLLETTHVPQSSSPVSREGL